MSESYEERQATLWLVHGRDTFAAEDYYVGAFATREEAEACAAEKLKLHDHEYAGELADRLFVTPPKGGGEIYECKRK